MRVLTLNNNGDIYDVPTIVCQCQSERPPLRTLYELNQTSCFQKEFGTGRRFTLYCPSPVQGSGLRFRSAKFGHRTDVNTCDITSNNRTFAPVRSLLLTDTESDNRTSSLTKKMEYWGTRMNLEPCMYHGGAPRLGVQSFYKLRAN